jgi:hypothetical protein
VLLKERAYRSFSSRSRRVHMSSRGALGMGITQWYRQRCGDQGSGERRVSESQACFHMEGGKPQYRARTSYISVSLRNTLAVDGSGKKKSTWHFS